MDRNLRGMGGGIDLVLIGSGGGIGILGGGRFALFKRLSLNGILVSKEGYGRKEGSEIRVSIGESGGE